MSLKIEVDNISSYIVGDNLDCVYNGLQKVLSYRVMGCEFTDRYNQIDPKTGERKWDGFKRLCWNQKRGIKFPTGLYSKVRDFMQENELEYGVSDKRVQCKRFHDYVLSEDIVFRPYQDKSISSCVKAQRGIVKIATGGGKTFIAAGLFQILGLKKMVFFAMSGDLILQAKDEIEKCIRFNGSAVEVGVIGGGMCDIRDITVCTIQTACRCFGVDYEKSDEDDSKEKVSDEVLEKRDDIKAFLLGCEAIIFDEVQHAACDTVKDIMERCNMAQYRFGLSASPWRDDKADLFIDAYFGRRIVDISASALIRAGYLVKPTIYFVKIETDLAPFSSYPVVYKRYVTDNEVRNNFIVKKAKEHSEEGRVVLILIKQINHGKLLEGMIEGSVMLSGKVSLKKRKQALDDFRDGKIKVVIATSIFDQGIDVKRVSCLILGGSGKSSTRALQRIGRVLRTFEDKEDAVVYDFMDTCKYLSKHARARLKIYKTEPEFEIVNVDMEDA
jgi:superfamily II DNA or RNA helicase